MDIYKQINLLKDEIIGEEIFREKNVACVVAISDEYVQFALDHISNFALLASDAVSDKIVVTLGAGPVTNGV